MAHRLIPTGPDVLFVEDVAARLIPHFPIFVVNKTDGVTQARNFVRQLTERGAPEEMIAEIEPKVPHGALVTVGNDFENACIQFLFLPDREIIVGYTCQQNEDQATYVTEQMAELLGCVVESL